MGREAHEGVHRLPTRRKRIGPVGVEVLYSGRMQWVFDLARGRFVCLSQDIDLDENVLHMHWKPYQRLEPAHDGRGVVVTTHRTTFHVPAAD